MDASWPRFSLQRRTARRPWLRPVGQVAGRDEREPDRPERPEDEHRAGDERDHAGDVSAVASRRLREAVRPARGLRRRIAPSRMRASRTRKSAPRHSNSSSRRASGPPTLDRLDDLAGRVACVDERVARARRARRARPAGGSTPGEQLARPVQPVLERPQRADRVLVEAVRVGGERLEGAQRPRQPAPEAGHRARVLAGRRWCRVSRLNPGRSYPPASYTRRRRGGIGGVGRPCWSSTTTTSLRLLCRVNLELDGYRVLEAAVGRGGARAARGASTSTRCSSTSTSATATAATCSRALGAGRVRRSRCSPARRRSARSCDGLADAVLAEAVRDRPAGGDGRAARRRPRR